MKLVVKMALGDKSITIDVEPSDSVGHIHAQIRDLWGIPLGNQRSVIFGGRPLQPGPGHTLASYGIDQDGCTVHLMVGR